MRYLLAFFGAVVGASLARNTMFGVFTGGMLGFLLGRVIDLQSAVNLLTAKLKAQTPPQPSPQPAPMQEPPVRTPEPAIPEHWAQEAPKPPPPAFPPKPAIKPPPAEDVISVAVRRARRWLLTGNVPVKLGVLISFFGVAFLLKYSIENRILQVPVTVWLVLVGAAGLALLVLGWRMRLRRRVYAISIQGGGIGILYLTVFAAFRLFHVLPGLAAFTVLVVIAGTAGWLAYVQRAQALAILGSVGGYLAPLLASTGSGNHVALFGYYLVLNLGVFSLAWFTAWRWLNLIGFTFTFVIGTWWGLDYYRPDLYASTQPFLIAFFYIYTTIAVLYALHQPPKLKRIVDSTLVFGTPLVAFPLQAALLRGSECGLAWSAAALAVSYVGYAYFLRRFAPQHSALLRTAFIALAVGFATLTVPLALDAQWTAGTWALEGAAMIWLGVRQSRSLPRLFGIGLVFFAGYPQLLTYGDKISATSPLLNGDFLGGMLIAGAALFATALLGRTYDGRQRYEPVLRVALFVWGALWSFSIGMVEIDRFVSWPYEGNAQLLYLAAWVWGGAWLSSRLQQPIFGVLIYGWLPTLGFWLFFAPHPFADLGWLVWPLALAAHFDGVRRSESLSPDRRERWWAAGMWLIGGLLLAEAYWATTSWWDISAGWQLGTAVVAVAIAYELTMRIGARRDPMVWMQLGAGPLLAAIFVLLLYGGLANDGLTSPVPYWPLLNPSDLAAAGALMLAYRWSKSPGLAGLPDSTSRIGWICYALIAWVLLTITVLRGVSHLGDIPYSFKAMHDSLLVHAALTLAWAAVGFTLMILGARRAQRIVWIGGASLMGIVVAKLFLVDLGGTGTVERIVSFIGVGALLLVVGYFAPVPKSNSGESTDSGDSSGSGQ